MKVSVWWDFENCNIPAGVNVFKIAHSITAAVRANGIKGPLQITAFGDVSQLARSNQEALSSTGINLAHIPNGGKNSADRSLLLDLMYWVSQNPPPAHLFLISGDRDFASILHRLRMSNYNVLLASPGTASGVLCSAASIMWNWNALVRGENLTGKHFNQPPDGPYGSWYGHFKVPLEDPFSVVEQPSSPQAEELSEPGLDSKLRPIPRIVMRQIRHILNSYPKGVSITELRSELGKSNVKIDKDFYGYRKFSHFLLSMPHILKLQSRGDGQYCVQRIASKAPEPVESIAPISVGPVSNSENRELSLNPKLHNTEISASGAVNGKSSLPLSPELKVKEPPTKVEEPPIKEEEPPPLGQKVAETTNAHAAEEHLSPVEGPESSSEVGFFKKIWRKWFSSKDGGFEKESNRIPEKCGTCDDSSEKIKSEEKCMDSKSQQADPIMVSISSSNDGSFLDKKSTRSSETYDDKSIASSNFFNKVTNWCKFWRASPQSDVLSDQSWERLNQINSHSEKHDCFSEDSLWSDIESFMATPKGSVLVSQSRTREQMAQNLRKEGPLVLGSLTETDLLHLVDLLISDKKWVEENPTQTSPFKVIWPVGKKSTSSQPHVSNGLSSIFLGTQSQSNLQRQLEHGEKRDQNLPHTGASRPVIDKKMLDRSRSEILAHCQKLVDEILKEYPEGFNMGAFRKLFLERYGYSLDVQKLGYQRLASLLQIMPGVKIESTYIVPSWTASKGSLLESFDTNGQENNGSGKVGNSDSELSDASRKEDDLDSPWEELGPVADTNSNRNEMESELRRKKKEETVRQVHLDYEPSPSDDDFSDSEGETLLSTGTDRQERPKISKEDSSLLRILDSWYSSKEDNKRRDGVENADGMIDCSRNDLKSSGSSGFFSEDDTSPINCRKKQRPVRSYSFVSDHGDDKDKLIDGILGSLKKSGESRMHS